MYFSDKIDKYLASWIGPKTWDSMHPADLTRFYCFLHALLEYGGGKFDETDFKEKIMHAAKRNHSPNSEWTDEEMKWLSERAFTFTTKAAHVVDYLEATRSRPFPDSEIENWDPPLK